MASEATGRDAMVSSGHPLATEVGLEVLTSGGNAVDAALAAAAVTWVTLPMMCGPGGDAFALVWDPKAGECVGFGAGGMAPRAATPEWFAERGHRLLPLDGPLAVGVPGSMLTMAALAGRFATRSLTELFAPAARIAREGHRLNSYSARHIADAAERLLADPESARVFLRGGAPPDEEDVLALPDLARSIELLGREGAKAIREGELAAKIAAYMRDNGGLLDEADLAADEVDVYAPPSVEYRGRRVYETAPPSQGLIVLEELAIAAGFDLAVPESAAAIHLLVEAKKLAVEDRNRHAGDPRFVDFDVTRLLSPEHADRRRGEIDPAQARRVVQPAAAGDTTYLCAVDRDGMAVSFIHSLSLSFGAAVTVPGTGIVLNDRVGRGFQLAEGHPNRLAPRKRTMSTLNCYLAERDGRAEIVGGTPGGDGQVQWNLQVLVGMLDAGRGPQAAVEAPRWTHGPTTDPHSLANPETLQVEDRVGEATIAELRQLGHPVVAVGPWSGRGSAQVIAIAADGTLRGGADPRGEGSAAGR